MRTDGSALQTLVDLDRRLVPRAAQLLDRLLGPFAAARRPTRVRLEPNQRRVLGALAVVLLACAIALFVIGA